MTKEHNNEVELHRRALTILGAVFSLVAESGSAAITSAHVSEKFLSYFRKSNKVVSGLSLEPLIIGAVVGLLLGSGATYGTWVVNKEHEKSAGQNKGAVDNNAGINTPLLNNSSESETAEADQASLEFYKKFLFILGYFARSSEITAAFVFAIAFSEREQSTIIHDVILFMAVIWGLLAAKAELRLNQDVAKGEKQNVQEVKGADVKSLDAWTVFFLIADQMEAAINITYCVAILIEAVESCFMEPGHSFMGLSFGALIAGLAFTLTCLPGILKSHEFLYGRSQDYGKTQAPVNQVTPQYIPIEDPKSCQSLFFKRAKKHFITFGDGVGHTADYLIFFLSILALYARDKFDPVSYLLIQSGLMLACVAGSNAEAYTCLDKRNRVENEMRGLSHSI